MRHYRSSTRHYPSSTLVGESLWHYKSSVLESQRHYSSTTWEIVKGTVRVVLGSKGRALSEYYLGESERHSWSSVFDSQRHYPGSNWDRFLVNTGVVTLRVKGTT